MIAFLHLLGPSAAVQVAPRIRSGTGGCRCGVQPDKTARISWSIKNPKPMVISEFGADALQGWHADALTRFSEEYQEDLYRKTIAMLRKIPAWRGVTPWILARLPLPAPGSAQRARRLESQGPDWAEWN